jgi:hypothetical protein
MEIDRPTSLVAACVILIVMAVYAYCLGIKDVYPPSHPWSGIALILLSVGVMRKSRRPVRGLWVVAVGSLLAAALWGLAAISL